MDKGLTLALSELSVWFGQVTSLLCASTSDSDILEFYKNITRRGVTGARGRQKEGRWEKPAKGQIPNPDSG